MRVRAIAARSPDSNAVGTVELECGASGLSIRYLGVAAFADDYAPAAFTRGTEIEVPWAELEEARVEGNYLWLRVAERITPLNRLMLMKFSSGDDASPENTRRRRLVIWLGVAAAIVLAALLAIIWAKLTTERLGTFGLGLAVVLSLVLLAVGFTADRRFASSATEAELREAFTSELEGYLPVLLRLDHAASPSKRWTIARLQQALPRSTTAAVITLSACALGALVTFNWARLGARAPVRDDEPEHPTATLTTPQALEKTDDEKQTPQPSAPSSPRDPTAPASSALTPVAAVREGAACNCPRAESSLWAAGMPRLSPLLIERRTRVHKDHVHLELELGLVNNGSRTLDDLTLRVQFFEINATTKRSRALREQPLYFEGPLRPGRAIKWHVEGRGNHFEVRVPELGQLSTEAGSAAPVDDFAELLRANHRPVRLHGALMLAWLNDARANSAVLDLREALREEEAPYLDRLLATMRPVRTCQTHASGTATASPSRLRVVQTCVYNHSDDVQTRPSVRIRGLNGQFDHRQPIAAPPVVVAEKSWRMPFELPPHTGRQITVSLDTTHSDGLKPDSFEAFAEP